MFSEEVQRVYEGIKDAILEIRPVDRPYRVQVGQFKVPFGPEMRRPIENGSDTSVASHVACHNT